MATVLTEKFSIVAKLKNDCLEITLKDFIDGKMYNRKLTKEDIGKDINSNTNLNDLFYGFYDNSVENEGNIDKGDYGNIIGKGKLN